VVERVMQGEKADACLTDFPYNIGKDHGGSWNDSQPKDDFWSLVVPAWLRMIVRVLKQEAHLITTFSERGLIDLVHCAQAAGFQHRHTGVWHNPSRRAGSYPGQWPYAWEPVLDFSMGAWRKLNNKNSVGFSDVWILESPVGLKSEPGYHPTEKPLMLYEDLVNLVTDEGEAILDPFLGSGTALIACEKLGRRCRGVEIAPQYVAVTLQRWADMTGQTPVRESGA
jgi:DNA modification methylase